MVEETANYLAPERPSRRLGRRNRSLFSQDSNARCQPEPPPSWNPYKNTAQTTRERPYTTRVRAALRRLRHDQRGAGTVELVVATPLLLLLILLIAQFALYMHATHIAQSAASEALSAARVSGGSAAAGNTEGQRILAQLGSGPLQGGSVNTQRGSTQASVTITGTATSVIPFMTLTVHAEAVGPIEKFTPPTGAGAAP